MTDMPESFVLFFHEKLITKHKEVWKLEKTKYCCKDRQCSCERPKCRYPHALCRGYENTVRGVSDEGVPNQFQNFS